MPPSKTATVTTEPQSSPLHAYHSNVMQTMCTQMVHHRRRSNAVDDVSAPLPLAKKPLPISKGAQATTRPQVTRRSSSKQSNLKDHVREEMTRRQKADRVLQDLSSDKSRQQARARETQRRNKWAKSIASACPPAEVPAVKKQMAAHHAQAQASRKAQAV